MNNSITYYKDTAITDERENVKSVSDFDYSNGYIEILEEEILLRMD